MNNDHLDTRPEATSAAPLDHEQVQQIIAALSVRDDNGSGPRLTENSPGVLLRRGQELLRSSI
ncbi:MAG TPA: hypothetical protein VIX83_09300 [Candidatus Cybelea sp.]